MAFHQRLPRLLGQEPDIKKNERGSSEKIETNFFESVDKIDSYQNTHSKYDFNEHKKNSNYNKNSRVYRLNTSDIYEVSASGKVKAIHNNENIITTQIKSIKPRPRSSKYESKRPWSNRSYRRKQNGSSLGRPTSKRSIFGPAKSNS